MVPAERAPLPERFFKGWSHNPWNTFLGPTCDCHTWIGTNKNKYDHLRNTSYWGKKLAAKPCLRPLKTSRRAVITTNFGWHVDVKHWKQIHENNTLFVHWRIRVISHAKLGGWCLPQWGFMTEYGKSIPKTRNQFVVTPDTVLPCPWVWINSVSKEVANLTMFLDTIMEMNMVRTVLYFLPSIVRNKICNK